MKTYPIADKGSFWLGLLGFVAVPVAGGLVSRLVAGATGKSVESAGQDYPTTQVMIGHATGLAVALYLRSHVSPGWQSFMKWGAISEGISVALAPIGAETNKALLQDRAVTSSVAQPLPPTGTLATYKRLTGLR